MNVKILPWSVSIPNKYNKFNNYMVELTNEQPRELTDLNDDG